MCDRYSYTHGYLCSSCFEELVALGAGADVAEFMNSEPKPRQNIAEAHLAAEEEFKLTSEL